MKKTINQVSNFLIFVSAILVIAFLSQPFKTIKILDISQHMSGFDLIVDYFSTDTVRQSSITSATIAILILTLIFSIIVILSSLIGLIRSNRPGTFRALTTFVLFGLTLACFILINQSLGGIPFSSVGWAAITNLCLSFLSFLCSIIGKSAGIKTSRGNKQI